MPAYKITDDETGLSVTMHGDSPPTEADIGEAMQIAAMKKQAMARAESAEAERDKILADRDGGFGLSALDNTVVGLGRGFTDIGQGVKQIGKEIFSSDADAQSYQDDLASEERAYQSAFGNSKAAMAGRIVGNIAGTALPGGIALRGAAAMPKIGQAANAIRGLSAAKQAALGGGVAAGMSPVIEGDFLTGKAKQVATGAVLGAGVAKGIEKGVGAIQKAINAPKQLWNKGVTSAIDDGSELAQEGGRLIDSTGVSLSIGERTGSKMATALENLARQSAITADDVVKLDLKKSDQLKTYLNSIMDDMSKGSYSAASMGEKVRQTVKGGVDDLLNKQRAQAAKDYGAVRQAAGGDPKVLMPNLAQEAKAMADELDGVAGSGSAGIKSELENYLRTLTQGGDELTEISLDAAMKNRSALSKATKGTGQIFKDIDSRQQRSMAARLLGAAERDFDEIAGASGESIGALLKTANGNYRAYAQAIEGIEASPLGRLLGEGIAENLATGGFNRVAPEKIMQRFKSMTPSEVKLSADMLERTSPEVLGDLRKYMIGDALEKSLDAATSAGALARDMINPNKFISSLAKNGDEYAKLKHLYTPEQLAKMDDAFDVMRRWSDKFGYNFSGTAPQGELMGMIKDVSVKGMASLAARTQAMRSIVESMADPKVTNLILKNRNLPRGEAGFQQAAGILAAIVGTRELTTPEAEQSARAQ